VASFSSTSRLAQAAPQAGSLLPAPQRWLLLLFLTAIAGIGIGLRLYRLGEESLWLDEVASIRNAELSAVDIWGADSHPPLYYLLLHYWMQWSDYDEGRLRLLSVLLSLAALPAIYLIGRRLGGVWVGLAAALLLACSPFDLRFAQELRMYALLNLAAAWALVGFVALLADPAGAARGRDLGAWTLLVLGSIVALYAHNLGVLLPLATTCVAATLWWRRPDRAALARRWLLANLLVLLAWAPFWPELLRQTGVATWYWIPVPTPGYIGSTQLKLAYGLPDLATPLAVAGLAGCLGLTVLGWRALPKGSPWRLALPALALLPALIAIVVSWTYRPVYLPRPLIWTGLPVALLLASGLVAALSQRRRPRLALGIALVLLTAAGNGYGLWHYYEASNKAAWREIAPMAVELSAPGGFAIMPHGDFVTLEYYLEREAGEAAPRVFGSFRWRLPVSLLWVGAMPEAARFVLLDVAWLPDPPLLTAALRWRFPCHAATRAGEHQAIALWLYEKREDCAR